MGIYYTFHKQKQRHCSGCTDAQASMCLLCSYATKPGNIDPHYNNKGSDSDISWSSHCVSFQICLLSNIAFVNFSVVVNRTFNAKRKYDMTEIVCTATNPTPTNKLGDYTEQDQATIYLSRKQNIIIGKCENTHEILILIGSVKCKISGGSRGVQGVRLNPLPLVFKYPIKMKWFGLSETKLFHFHGIFKKI